MILALIVLLVQHKTPDRPLQGPAAKCGTEIPWTTDWNRAVGESRRTGKPILWWVDGVAGSPMDRKLVLRNYMLAGPWMMPDVVSIVSRRFVPLRIASDGRHGVRRMRFIEPGIVILDARTTPIAKLDRIGTFQEDHLRAFLLRHATAAAEGTTAEELFRAGAYEAALGKNPDRPTRARILHRLGRPFEEKDLPAEDRARDRLARDDAAGAEKILRPLGTPEASYLLGAALHLRSKDDAGRAVWNRLVKQSPESRWAWKAAAELARDGPFVRGLEVYAKPRAPMRAIEVGPALRFLLSMQRAHGGWDDSNYNFGGDDSLPNVYMASTALIALALLEWKEADPRIPKALERAETYLRDETRIARDDKDEILWAYVYRLLFFARTRDAKMMRFLVGALEKMQLRSGAFRHEYANPFATASTLHALRLAQEAGAEIPKRMVQEAVGAIRKCRKEGGLFTYGFGDRRRPRAEGAAGRMPLCELALFLWGASARADLQSAVDTAFRHHALLEAVRKYDDHADRYANGGFFFWYDLHGRAEAIHRLRNRVDARRLIATVLSIAEPDGAWVDSHELGRPYGTAMALLVLRRCSEVR